MRLLLDRGAEVNKAKNDGATSLCIASHNAHEAVVRLLLDRGADVDKAMNNGATPLYVASLDGHEAVAGLLLDRGSKIDSAKIDGSALQPLHTHTHDTHTHTHRSVTGATPAEATWATHVQAALATQ